MKDKLVNLLSQNNQQYQETIMDKTLTELIVMIILFVHVLKAN